ncbi:unnamed protein product [Auanema sp. JU1783]|nr:unnamed protein product [Auanema sp. JU1783]
MPSDVADADDQSQSAPEDVIYLFLPRSHELSISRLLTSISLIGLFTISICGNASHLALQCYARRFQTSSNRIIQHLIAVLYILCFLVPMALPCVILEKLVSIWMFAPHSCSIYHFFFSCERALIPWITVFLYVFVLNQSRSNVLQAQRPLLGLCCLIMLILIFFIILPQAFAGVLDVVFYQAVQDVKFVMVVQISRCKKDMSELYNFIHLIIEFAIPMGLQLYFLFRLLSVRHFSSSKHFCRNMFIITLLQFICHPLYYLPSGLKNSLSDSLPKNFYADDLPSMLPFIVPAFIWLPLSSLSVCSYNCRKNDEADV